MSKRRWLKPALWIGASLLILVGGLYLYKLWMLERNVDFLFEHVLAQGDAAAAYNNCDPGFQVMYSREAFSQFARDNPQLFQRDKVTALSVLWRWRRNELYVVLKTRVGGGEVDYYCRPSELQRWRLVGILPGLDAAIPMKLEP